MAEGAFEFDDSIFDAVRRATQATEYGKAAVPRAAEQAKIGQAINARQRFLAAQQQAAAPATYAKTVGTPAAVTNGQWKLGAAPTHHGYAGMQGPAQEWVRRVLGQYPDLRFTSGYRSPEHNRRVGGVANSGHTRGWKADFVGPSMYEAAKWLKSLGARTLMHDAGSGMHLDASFEGL